MTKRRNKGFSNALVYYNYWTITIVLRSAVWLKIKCIGLISFEIKYTQINYKLFPFLFFFFFNLSCCMIFWKFIFDAWRAFCQKTTEFRVKKRQANIDARTCNKTTQDIEFVYIYLFFFFRRIVYKHRSTRATMRLIWTDNVHFYQAGRYHTFL